MEKFKLELLLIISKIRVHEENDYSMYISSKNNNFVQTMVVS